MTTARHRAIAALVLASRGQTAAINVTKPYHPRRLLQDPYHRAIRNAKKYRHINPAKKQEQKRTRDKWVRKNKRQLELRREFVAKQRKSMGLEKGFTVHPLRAPMAFRDEAVAMAEDLVISRSPKPVIELHSPYPEFKILRGGHRHSIVYVIYDPHQDLGLGFESVGCFVFESVFCFLHRDVDRMSAVRGGVFNPALAYIDPGYRGLSLARIVYEDMLNRGLTLVSNSHSPDASRLWDALNKKWPGGYVGYSEIRGVYQPRNEVERSRRGVVRVLLGKGVKLTDLLEPGTELELK